MRDGKVAATCGSGVDRRGVGRKKPESSIKHSAENQGLRVITGGGMYPERATVAQREWEERQKRQGNGGQWRGRSTEELDL